MLPAAAWFLRACVGPGRGTALIIPVGIGMPPRSAFLGVPSPMGEEPLACCPNRGLFSAVVLNLCPRSPHIPGLWGRDPVRAAGGPREVSWHLRSCHSSLYVRNSIDYSLSLLISEWSRRWFVKEPGERGPSSFRQCTSQWFKDDFLSISG